MGLISTGPENEVLATAGACGKRSESEKQEFFKPDW